MNIFKVKNNKIPGTNYKEVKKIALDIFIISKLKTKRRPYIRSIYFNKEKIFFDYFWPHLFDKNYNDKIRRLKYFNCAVELMEKSRNKPDICQSLENKNEIFYRFYGETINKEIFCVQIKQNKKTGQKYFMSCFSKK